MAKDISLFADISRARRIPPMPRTRYEIIGPYQMRPFTDEITLIHNASLLLRPRVLGMCHADVRYIAGHRPPEVLRERLPMAPIHEGVAEVLEIGDAVKGFTRGQRVIAIPNLPCYVHNPLKYHHSDIYCHACRPGGAGENYCLDVIFLASNAHGLAQSCLLHPAIAALPVPDAAPDEIAALAEPLSVVEAGIATANLAADSQVVVLGAGVMGYATAIILSSLHKIPKERLLVTDLDDVRLASVSDFATTHNIRSSPRPPKQAGELDRAFECVGGKVSQHTIEQAIQWLRPGGRCVMIGVAEEPVPVRTRRMLDKGLELRGTTRSARCHYEAILPLLADKDFQEKARRILSGLTFPGNSCEGIIDAARATEDPKKYGKVLLDWRTN